MFSPDEVFENPEVGKELVMKSATDDDEIEALEKRLKELKKKKLASGT